MASLTRESTRASALDGLVAVLRRLETRFEAWRARQREVARIERELNTYSSRNLADLGLTSADIPLVARGEYSRG